ncbi:HAMP domain-containing protein [Curtobacterium flaccumfaciens]|nr:HAMP domain-containing protein [Curtobacterium flaccumfaciens]
MVSISTNVYSQRRDQIESESARATIVAQGIFDAATAAEDNNQSELETLQNEAQQAILSNTTSPGGTSIAIERSPGQSTPQTLQTIASQDFPDAVITDDLRKEVGQNTGRLSLQPVQLDDDGRRVPGLAVGSTLQIPSAGQYELYLVYDLSDAQQTLDFVSQTLSIGGVALMVLIALVTSLVVRLVVVPIRGAAETSRKIAAGRLDERIPVRGQDDLATLARSFNGMAEAVSRQITQLAELSRVQQRFVSDVSHELRTPLTTIRLAGDMLYDSRHAFRTVGRSVRRAPARPGGALRTAPRRPARDLPLRRPGGPARHRARRAGVHRRGHRRRVPSAGRTRRHRPAARHARRPHHHAARRQARPPDPPQPGRQRDRARRRQARAGRRRQRCAHRRHRRP